MTVKDYIRIHLKLYDVMKPKMDEIAFVNAIVNLYDITKSELFKLIKEIRLDGGGVMGAGINYLRFEHNGKDYRYNSDKIEYRNPSYEKGDEDYGIDEWNKFIDLPLSNTKYETNKKDIETICVFALNVYEQGRKRGKWDKQREICEVIGADY